MDTVARPVPGEKRFPQAGARRDDGDGPALSKAEGATEEGRSWVTIAVRDTGPGISSQEQDKVFDLFFRGELADSGHAPGTGLGLSIAYEIVRAHGGQITVESQLEEGSTFTIWLPSAE